MASLTTISGTEVKIAFTKEDIVSLAKAVGLDIGTNETNSEPIVTQEPTPAPVPQIPTVPQPTTTTSQHSYKVEMGGNYKKVSWNIVGGTGKYAYRLGDNVYYGAMFVDYDVEWDVVVIDNGKEYPVKVNTYQLGTVNFNGTTTELEKDIEVQVVTSQTAVENTTPVTNNKPLIGAVRWDWWADFDCTTLWLSPKKWQYKAPFFAKKISDNQLFIKGNTQEILDKEIEYALYAGINYFAFNWYQGYDKGYEYNGSYGRELFKKSAKKGNLKMCFILEHTSLNNTNFNFDSLKELCADLGRDDYQKIDGRPLLYYMTYPPLNPSQVEAINSTYLRFYPNKPLPYIVNAIQVGEQEAQQNNKTGVAAWSQYTGYGKDGDINMRERYKRAGVKLIPTMTVGWHTSPIGENPCKWYQNAPIESEIRLTGDALKSHLQDTINFVNTNRETCEANTILCYAWNEHAEGGYISPTIVPSTGQIDTSTIEVFRSVLKPNE